MKRLIYLNFLMVFFLLVSCSGRRVIEGTLAEAAFTKLILDEPNFKDFSSDLVDKYLSHYRIELKSLTQDKLCSSEDSKIYFAALDDWKNETSLNRFCDYTVKIQLGTKSIESIDPIILSTASDISIRARDLVDRESLKLSYNLILSAEARKLGFQRSPSGTQSKSGKADLVITATIE